ncbi:MAG: hypothetical protein MUC31_06240 [Bacteroidales bacterium]|jgi:hypothetical protein|nr:hypothetical protein [Bacteroidales bacterium]
MKTLKIAVIAALVAFTMVSLSYADGIKEKPKFKLGVCISLEQAIKIPGLVRAMYQQISLKQVLEAHQHVYVAKVYYDGRVYSISGTLDQWLRFFNMDGISPINTKIRGMKKL